jgi:MarR family transcriptional regulator, organic hydroperoxide resistance regulator
MTEAPETLGQVLDFMRLLWAVDHGLTRLSRKMERTIGVTGPQRLAIRIVGQHPGISAGALARTLHVHPSTLTGVLRRLVERGMLDRTQDPADARRALFRLTARGEELDAARNGTVEARVRTALAGAAADDVDAARRLLERIARTLGRER